MWDAIEDSVEYLKDFYRSGNRKSLIAYGVGGLAISGTVATTSLTLGLATLLFLGCATPILVTRINKTR